MDPAYEHLFNHYKNPRNFGKIEKPDKSFSGGNPYCGDEITIHIKLKDEKVEDIKFHGRGCAISQASASILTEMIKGKSVEDIRRVNKEHLLKSLGVELSPVRLKCALLSLEVVRAALFGEKVLLEIED